MSLSTTLITLLVMLWHAIVGCCAHHPHSSVFSVGDKSEADVVSVEHVSATHACSHHHAKSAPSHDTEDGGHHSHPSPCSDVDCVFSATNLDGHLALSKSISSQLHFDSRCIVGLNGNLGSNDDFALPNLSLSWRVAPPVYIQFQSLLI